MATLAPSVAAVRVAVRRALAGLPAQSLVLVACSGGADSLALAAAAAFVAPRQGLRCGLVTVDHQLQLGSADRAEAVAKWGEAFGLSPVVSTRVEVDGRVGGPEAAAREARYEALIDTARQVGAGAVLLGHTRDDQAETVLLALARGAGPRGLAAMPASREVDGVLLLRPLLDVARAETAAACEALGLEPWHDPHNTDPSYARSRVRALLPSLTEALGPGLVGNLARAAALAAADTELLDGLAAAAAVDAADGDGGLRVSALAELPAALRTRVLHSWARKLGVSGSALSARHVDALDALVTRWHGQGPVALPGALLVVREGGRLTASQG
ncbi:tRNA lysidine(34) synthetase TilS [Planosporangium flavigriseum]|uniref:tRNA(Ile)-lysidine synthase n=1 Tax=Planosporangium flavigriseum TaxID=373681 RepID=A0A8J3LUY8_9ACTN|nr:tRNA lysidine(34) synthetase TilS [Planosporangium flavigriseum]NJC63752.1 tRNA lysidine(34) synthetase TilS [Planosporangium flavigriseum]GIG73750.1 tRNA(Ile)-lysidine synthase [Planosporangium flavigriseum]